MFLTLISIVTIGLTQPSTSSLQTNCPADDPLTRELVERFQTRPAFAQDRTSLGTAGVPLDQITVLSGKFNALPCSHFTTLFGASGVNPRWRWAAYRVGSHYFVAFRFMPPAGTQRLGATPLFIYDSSLKQVGAFAM
jgi:hypothetical protein